MNCAYHTVSSNFRVKHLVVIHRHGDRAQISKNVGPKFPENPPIADKWANMLLDEEELTIMMDRTVCGSNLPNEMHPLFGWDIINKPYSQLTKTGSLQLQNVGRLLRNRYNWIVDHSVDISSRVIARSTNFSRTIQSMRALLMGLLPDEANDSLGREKAIPNTVRRLREHETLTPMIDGRPCPALTKRRAEIYSRQCLVDEFPRYEEFEERMNKLFGFEEKTDWFKLVDVLCCYKTHPHVNPEVLALISDEDYEMVRRIGGRIWGIWYKDDKLNRLGIGRFLRELHQDICTVLDGKLPSMEFEAGHIAENDAPKILIYSGHDSTIVPVMCALHLYDDVWPQYGAFLTLEIAESVADGKIFVRAVFNDEQRHLVGYREDYWCPWELVEQRLREMSISHEEYLDICARGEDAVAEEPNKFVVIE